MITHTAKRIFEKAVDDYHIKDRVDQPFSNPYDTDVDFLEHLLYRKAWIDTVQWHYEDIIRDPQIDPVAALKLKRQIDASEEHRLSCQQKLDILLEQRVDLCTAIDTLVKDIRNGDKYMKVYKQMKMYNDDELNPVLRGQNKK